MAIDPGTLRRLRRPLALTRAGLVAERGVRAFWPLWVVVALALALWFSGVIPEGALWARGLWGSLLGLALVCAALGIRRFRWPRHGEAVARLDQGLIGKPLASLGDTPAIGAGDTNSMALWQAHQARMRVAASGARAPRPDLRLSDRDPFALRYLVLLALFAVVLFSGAQRAGSVSQTPELAPVSGQAWEGWAEPPLYTGRPVLYLNELADGPLSLPEGTDIVLRFYQGDAPDLYQTVGEAAQQSDGRLHFTVAQSGEITIEARHWQVEVEPDLEPLVSILNAAERVRGGGFTLPFSAEDDFGLRAGHAEITLDLEQVDRRYGLAALPAPRDPVVLDLPMPFGRDRSAIEEALSEDLSTHPWANLPVMIRLVVSDDAGQIGESEALPMILPGKRFFEPVAAALAEQRRDLMWAAVENGPRVARLLRATAWHSNDLFRVPAQQAELRAIIAALEPQIDAGFTDTQALDDVTKRLWALALDLEEGALDDARARLERARKRLADAMRRGADPAEIAELMEELRAATDDYMDLLAENALPEENQTDEPDTGETWQMTSMDEIQRMMDEIQQLMEEGRMEEAQALMEQLNQLLDNLQMREGGEGDPSGRRQMEELGETLRDQQDLSDDAFRDLQDRFNGRDPQPGEGGEDGETLADRQRDLADELESQRRGLDDLTGDEADAARDALDDAAQAMEDAAQALDRDDLPGALDDQARALEALRDGLRDLGEALDRADREDMPDGSDDLSEQGASMRMPEQQDPLGREAGRGDPEGALGGSLDDGQDPRARSQQLLDELRRRAGEIARPEDERAYLERLLDRF